MSANLWGILGPGRIVSERRARTLGLGATVRAMNELAVPGMGNVYFGKQLALSILGIAVAERARARAVPTNIETANAIEALACRIAFDGNGWKPDIRLRGSSKMRGKGFPTFSEARKRNYYVTQPMRMATVQPLLALGFVAGTSERFNAYTLPDGSLGSLLVQALCAEFPAVWKSRNLLERLCDWVLKDLERCTGLEQALSPLEPLPKTVRDLVRGAIVRGDDWGATRRKAILEWVSAGKSVESLASRKKPSQLDHEHWRDVQTGALFFAVQRAALVLLNEVESFIGALQEKRLALSSLKPNSFKVHVAKLKEAARIFLDLGFDPSPFHEATRFCKECVVAETALESLVRRDDRVLRISGGFIVPGPAFQGQASAGLDRGEEEEAEEKINTVSTGHTFSRRIENMFLLSRDLDGKLSTFLRSVE